MWSFLDRQSIHTRQLVTVLVGTSSFFLFVTTVIPPFLEFEEFMAVDVEESPEQEKEVDDNFEELLLEENLIIKTSIQEPPNDLKLKPLSKHLEYAFLEIDSLLLIVISALLKADEKKHLVFVLKCHREAFAFKNIRYFEHQPIFLQA
nr:reverse transcriptase domain-containing protein [Tanacetum cinerariifolium]